MLVYRRVSMVSMVTSRWFPRGSESDVHSRVAANGLETVPARWGREETPWNDEWLMFGGCMKPWWYGKSTSNRGLMVKNTRISWWTGYDTSSQRGKKISEGTPMENTQSASNITARKCVESVDFRSQMNALHLHLVRRFSIIYTLKKSLNHHASAVNHGKIMVNMGNSSLNQNVS